MLFSPAVNEVRTQLPAAANAVQVFVPSLTETLPVSPPLPGAFTETMKLTVYGCPVTVAVLRSERTALVVLDLLIT